MPPRPDRFLERAVALLQTAPLIDGHNDLAIALRTRVGLKVSSVDLRRPVDGLDTDIPRLRAGHVGGQFWSIWVPAELPEERALPMALEQLDIADGFPDAYPTRSSGQRPRTRSIARSRRVASHRSSDSRAGR